MHGNRFRVLRSAAPFSRAASLDAASRAVAHGVITPVGTGARVEIEFTKSWGARWLLIWSAGICALPGLTIWIRTELVSWWSLVSLLLVGAACTLVWNAARPDTDEDPELERLLRDVAAEA